MPMISVERLMKPHVEKHPDEMFLSHHHTGFGRPFPPRYLYSNSSSLFDYDDITMKKDMNTLFDSAFSSLFDIRHGRYYSYDDASPFTNFERTDGQSTSDGKFVPIKVEYGPERYKVSNNIKFRLLNGSPKETNDFPESFYSPSSNLSASVNLNSPKDLEACSTLEADKRVVSPKAMNVKSSGSNGVACFNSRSNLQKYQAENEYNERKADVWKSIPVHHCESSASTSFEKPNTNNNSSGKRYSQVSSNNVSKEAHSSHTNEADFSSTACTRDSSILSIQPSADTLSDQELEENEINIPPNYPIYDVLKLKLAKDGRAIDYIRGDGNCFFRALSKGLYRSEQYHKTVRSYIVDIIATNKPKFAQFVDKENVQEHVTRMSENYCWATTCEIYAAATLLQRDIFMLTPDHLNESYSWLLFKPVFKLEISNDISPHSCYISLCNTNGNHYDRVVPDHGGCNCFLPFPQLGIVV